MTKFNFLKELAKKEVVVPHINMWFENANFPPELDLTLRLHKEKDTAFHPSSDGALCSRTLYAKRKGDLPYRPIDAGLQKTFMVGHYWHELLQHILVDELHFSRPSDVEKQRVVYRVGKAIQDVQGSSIGAHFKPATWWAKGFIDVAHCEVPGHGDFLIDIKTMGSHAYRLDTLPPGFARKYEAQLQLYMDWENMDEAIIIAVEKDSPHRLKEFRFSRDPVAVERIYARWDKVIAALEPPPCDLCKEVGEECPAAAIYH